MVCSLKLVRGDQMRKVNKVPNTWEQMSQLLNKLFGHFDFHLLYPSEDDEIITIKDDQSLQRVISLNEESQSVRLILKEIDTSISSQVMSRIDDLRMSLASFKINRQPAPIESPEQKLFIQSPTELSKKEEKKEPFSSFLSNIEMRDSIEGPELKPADKIPIVFFDKQEEKVLIKQIVDIECYQQKGPDEEMIKNFQQSDNKAIKEKQRQQYFQLYEEDFEPQEIFQETFPVQIQTSNQNILINNPNIIQDKQQSPIQKLYQLPSINNTQNSLPQKQQPQFLSKSKPNLIIVQSGSVIIKQSEKAEIVIQKPEEAQIQILSSLQQPKLPPQYFSCAISELSDNPTLILTGQEFRKKVYIQNTSCQSWPQGTQLVPQDSLVTTISSPALPQLLPSQSAQTEISLISLQEGYHEAQWKLQLGNLQFGTVVMKFYGIPGDLKKLKKIVALQNLGLEVLEAESLLEISNGDLMQAISLI